MIDTLSILRDHQSVIEGLETVRPQIELVAQRMIACLDRDGKIL
jgi:hypothetical protein